MESLKEGFDSIFQSSQLTDLFTADELEQLFCGNASTQWDTKVGVNASVCVCCMLWDTKICIGTVVYYWTSVHMCSFCCILWNIRVLVTMGSGWSHDAVDHMMFNRTLLNTVKQCSVGQYVDSSSSPDAFFC